MLNLSRMSDRASEALTSLREHHKKYAVVAVASFIAISVVYKDFSSKVRRSVLISESILRLTGRNVLVSPSRNKGNPGSTHGLSGNGAKAPTENPKGNGEPSYVPPEATVEIAPKDPNKKLTDVVNIRVRNSWGFTREPGLDLSVAPLGIGLDFKFFYAWKLGAEVGVLQELGGDRLASPTAGVSYRLDSYSLLKNTELSLNYAPLLKIPLTLGLRVNF